MPVKMKFFVVLFVVLVVVVQDCMSQTTSAPPATGISAWPNLFGKGSPIANLISLVLNRERCQNIAAIISTITFGNKDITNAFKDFCSSLPN
ncbi:hypothetical protein CHUAL_009776 [Chamberlinius hualienensis]